MTRAIGVAVALVLLVGCGGGDDDAAADDETEASESSEGAASVPSSTSSTLATTTTAAPPATTEYTVQSGDTLYDIAERNGSTVEAITAANALTDPDALQVGQVLQIPPSP